MLFMIYRHENDILLLENVRYFVCTATNLIRADPCYTISCNS